MLASPVLPTPAAIIATVERFCVSTAPSDPATVAARAASASWHAVPPTRGLTVAARSPDGMLKVQAGEVVSPGEHVETCSVASDAALSGVAAALADALATAPAFALAGSATFVTYRDAAGWHPAPRDRAAFARVKAAGQVYSLIVSEGAHGSGIVVINPRPDSS